MTSEDQSMFLAAFTFTLSLWVAFTLGRDWDELAGSVRRRIARRRLNRRLRREYRARRRHFCRTGKVLL
jgi:hypothetical protein